MAILSVWVGGTPKGQPRPKAFSRGGIASVYDPGTAEGWKGSIALAVREHLPTTPHTGPIKVKLQFSFTRPGAHYGSKNKEKYLKTSAPSRQTGKPDCDNLAKAVMDCLTQLRLWEDDSQVCELLVSKWYSDLPGLHLDVEEIKDA